MQAHASRKLALLLILVFAFMSADAMAKGKRKRKGKRNRPVAAQKIPPADNEKIERLMGEFKWGMSPERVLGIMGNQIDARYAEKIKDATGNVYQQDKLRSQAKQDKARLKKSFIEFKGQKTPWEVSIVQGEFDHKNDEAMLEIWEKDESTGKDQRRFFFFHNGALWKMFIAFNAERFDNKGFPEFKAAMENIYGPGRPGEKNDVAFVEWRSKDHYMRALDLTQFYGNFVLAVSDTGVESMIYDQRETNNPKRKRSNKVVDSIVEGEGDEDKALPNPNDNVIDDIVGN